MRVSKYCLKMYSFFFYLVELFILTTRKYEKCSIYNSYFLSFDDIYIQRLKKVTLLLLQGFFSNRSLSFADKDYGIVSELHVYFTSDSSERFEHVLICKRVTFNL